MRKESRMTRRIALVAVPVIALLAWAFGPMAYYLVTNLMAR